MKLTIKNLAQKFKVSESGIRMAIYNKKTLPYEKIGTKVFIEEEDYIKYQSEIGVIGISNSEIQKWYEDYCINLSFKDIAKKYNRCESTISSYFKKIYNLSPKSYHEKLSKDTLDIYKKAYEEYIHLKNKSLTQIAKDYNIEFPHRFIHYLRRCGFKIKSMSEVRSFVGNEDFFENIDSEIKAYLLGFFAADGHIEKRKDYDSYTLRVGVQLNDYHILKLYTKHISEETAIYCKKNLASISITCKKIGEDLLKMGYDNNKTYTMNSIPDLPIPLIYHFIRGFFDGDGSIILQARRVGRRLSGYNREFNIAAYNKNILESIAKILNISSFDIRKTEPKTLFIQGVEAHFKSCFSLTVNNKKDLKMIYDKLYTNSNFFFKRKKDKLELSFLEPNEIEAALQGNL